MATIRRTLQRDRGSGHAETPRFVKEDTRLIFCSIYIILVKKWSQNPSKGLGCSSSRFYVGLFLHLHNAQIKFFDQKQIFWLIVLLNMSFRVGIIGGGVAGSTLAIRLCQEGINSVIFEAGPELVNGPPFCHLHAGGALYRDIPVEHSIMFLKQSIQTLRLYQYSANARPTLFTIPLRDPGEPQEIIYRLNILKSKYCQLVEEDKANEVLGKPEDYFKTFSEEEVYRLVQRQCPPNPETAEDWLIPVAKALDLKKFKFPFIMVREYGLSSMRTAAHAKIVLEKNNLCQVLYETTVVKTQSIGQKQWVISYKKKGEESKQIKVQYLVNACGYKSGLIDQMAGFKKKRMVEFKASYLIHWNQSHGHWPELVIHGKRNSPFGMAQLTPYCKNIFQVHGMTDEITLFKDGLIDSSDSSPQPKFNNQINSILERGWEEEEVIARTQKAISHISNFVESFCSAEWTRKPLFGAQQIPGSDPELRLGGISHEEPNYTRLQIVKASAAIRVANGLIKRLKQKFKLEEKTIEQQQREDENEVLEMARKIAKQRGYPVEIADFYS